MRAMILAGGLSTRLYPLTKQVPKPLVPVAGEPNAVHLIRYLKQHGFDEIAINVHYLADAIVARLGDGSEYDAKLTYLHEKVLLGSAGAVQQMEAFFTRDDFVVVGCDDLTDLPLDRLLAFHRKSSAIATIGLVKREEVDQYGVVVTDSSGRITGFQEKPAKGTEQSNLANTGIYAFTPEIFEHIPAGEFYDFGKNVFPLLQQAAAPFYGFDAGDAYWCDIGTIPEYWRATTDILEGRFKIPGASARIQDGVLVGKGAVIEEGSVITGPSVISDGVRIATGAKVTNSILWEGAVVGARATVEHTIVGMNCTVKPGSTLTNTVVANE